MGIGAFVCLIAAAAAAVGKSRREAEEEKKKEEKEEGEKEEKRRREVVFVVFAIPMWTDPEESSNKRRTEEVFVGCLQSLSSFFLVAVAAFRRHFRWIWVLFSPSVISSRTFLSLSRCSGSSFSSRLDLYLLLLL